MIKVIIGNRSKQLQGAVIKEGIVTDRFLIYVVNGRRGTKLAAQVLTYASQLRPANGEVGFNKAAPEEAARNLQFLGSIVQVSDVRVTDRVKKESVARHEKCGRDCLALGVRLLRSFQKIDDRRRFDMRLF